MPRLAVCICTCNRPRLLDRLFAILAGLDPGGIDPRDLAFVVVDNRPNGAARAVCEAWRPHLPFQLSFVEERECGISFARNRALETALALDADLIAFIDDDDEPCLDWLRRLVETQQETGADMVFGIWRHPATLTLPERLARIRFFQPMRVENRNSYGLPAWAGTFNVLFTRQLIERVRQQGLVFRPEFALTGGGDTDLFIRAHRAGFTHAVAGQSVVYRIWEANRMTLRGVVRRAFRIGCTRMQLAAAHQPPERYRAIRRCSAWKLTRTLLRVPVRLHSPSSLAVLLVRASQYAGELYAGSGRRYVYYDSPQPVAMVRPRRQWS